LKESESETLNAIEWRKVKIVKKGINKVKLESLKPGDVAYHDHYGYLKLEKYMGIIDLDSYKNEPLQDWECIIIHEPKDMNKPNEQSRVVVSPKEFRFFISVSIVIYLEKRVVYSKVVAGVNDII